MLSCVHQVREIDNENVMDLLASFKRMTPVQLELVVIPDQGVLLSVCACWFS